MFAKAFVPSVGAVFGRKLMRVRLLQLLKAEFPMLVTLAGIVMLVSLLQLLKAEFPMLVTLAGIVMLVSLLQS